MIANETLRRVDLSELDRLSVPDTDATRRAEEVCLTASSPALVNHCFRSYAWGALLGLGEGIAWDAELLYVAAMLHSLGLTETYDRGGCFEHDGAEAARSLLTTLGWHVRRSAVVADAIFLQMHDIEETDGPEAQLLAIGTSADTRGERLDEIDVSMRDAVLERFPRLGFKEHFIALLEDQAARKPRCVVHYYLTECRAAEKIRSAPFDE